jgi:CheY-like chemotaxis protein/MinD-like ATPase involved in chromosome partitioning or flagellar assembly
MQERILIIDDDFDTLRLVGLALEDQGYRISAAASGAQGLAKAAAEKPDVILLDIMMPVMDGYEVARRLKRDPQTKDVPILMLTAKSQLDDKLTGYEAGADDFVMKPSDPAELVAHIRVLLERKPGRKVEVRPASREDKQGYLVALLAARGGLGVSTLASNLAAALQLRTRLEVILVELTPGHGTLGMDLGTPNPRGLKDLLSGSADDITRLRVKSALVTHGTGLRLLLASENPRDVTLVDQTKHFEALVACLAGLASFVVMDLGVGLPPFAAKILPVCDVRILVTEASLNTVAHTRILLEEIVALGINTSNITIVLNNRARFDTQLPWAQVERTVGHPISTTLTPAPDLFVAAARRHVPGVVAMPDNVTSQQILKLADQLLLERQGA